MDDKVRTFVITTLNLAAVLTFCWKRAVSTIRIEVSKRGVCSASHEIRAFSVHWSSFLSRQALEVWMPFWHHPTPSDPERRLWSNAIRVNHFWWRFCLDFLN
jgi:hypothetical protein